MEKKENLKARIIAAINNIKGNGFETANINILKYYICIESDADNYINIGLFYDLDRDLQNLIYSNLLPNIILMISDQEIKCTTNLKVFTNCLRS